MGNVNKDFKEFTGSNNGPGTNDFPEKLKDGTMIEVYNDPESYYAPPELINAVNLAQLLGRPLLLEGEPGCGKTRLAHAIAYELGYPLHECYIRSTHQAKELLYSFDAVRRLYDIQNPANKGKEIKDENYINYGKLGDAIRFASERESSIPSVVLIDEIDKADIDFPNDLLNVIDRMSFEVPEIGEKFEVGKGQKKPLFIITSNQEKELPKPFLRRCLYYYMSFPDEEHLNKIVETHFKDKFKEEKDNKILTNGVDKFISLRGFAINWRKKPGTSEMLDWLKALVLKKANEGIDSLKDISFKDLPFKETLIKTEHDRNSINNQR